MDFSPLFAGSQHNLADQRTNVLAGFPIGLWVGEGLGETSDLAPVEFGDVRMNVRHVGRCVGEAAFDLGLLLCQLVHPRLHGRLVHAVLDRRRDPPDTALDLPEAAAVRFS